ncbi:Ig-like domain-containing protein [Sediminicoccus sp. BL-A-41-H5]|uniref:Ig-like domain-containing protein n=1 Tax=Sediminicoccus sp. BL-A-41-H5 TaxID=3421106 RepID=UPI003D664DC8
MALVRPPRILSVQDGVGAQRGFLANGATTDDATLSLVGEAVPGGVVTIFDGVVVLGTATANASGAWSFNTPALVLGAHSLSATVSIPAGVSANSDPFMATVASSVVLPGAPTIASVRDNVVGGKFGVLASGDVTNDGTLSITGSAAANATVRIFDGGVLIGTTAANAQGNWSWTSPLLADGVHLISAAVVNNGLPSLLSNSFRLTVDTAATAGTLSLAGFSDTGASAADFVSTDNVFSLSLAGQEAGATVVWQRSANGGATWTNTTAAQSLTADGTYLYRARVTDGAGNVATSNVVTMTLDRVAAPATQVTLASDTGASSTDRITNIAQVNVGGLQQGATWQYSTNAGSTWTTGSGSSFALPEGTYAAGRVLVRQTDLAGNTSVTTALAGVTVVDLTGPASGVLSLSGYTDTGASASDFVSSDNTFSLALAGQEAGATIVWQRSTDGGVNWSTTTQAQSAIAAGSYQFRALVSDAAGNVTTTNVISMTVTASAPASGVLSLSNFTDSGTSSSDFLSNDSTFTLSLAGQEAGATVVWQRSTDGGANWSTTTAQQSNIADGSYQFRAVVTDGAGNSSTSNVVSATIDTAAPAAGVLSLSGFTDSGTSSSDFLSNDSTFTLSLAGQEAGATVVWQRSTDGGANWSTTTAQQSSIADGSYQFRAVVTDAAGNSSTSNVVSTTIDATVAKPTVALANDTGVAGDNITTDGSVNVGSLEALATWQYSLDSGNNWTSGSGTSFSVPVGTYAAGAVLVRQTDAAGNVSANAAFLNQIQIVPPVTFTFAEAAGTVTFGGTATGAITVTIAADGSATFARQGVNATGTVAGVGGKLIDVAAGTAFVVDLQGTGTAETFTLNAPKAAELVLQGSLGAGVDSFVIVVNDVSANTADTRTLKVVTSAMTSTADRLVFDFADTLDLVVLSSGSVISSAFNTLEIKRGTVDTTQASLPTGLALEINSSVVLSVSQISNVSSVQSATGLGSVSVSIGSDAELSAFLSFLATQPADFFLGSEVSFTGSNGYTPSGSQLQQLNAAVEAASTPVFTLSEAAGVVTLGGNATGDISISINSSGAATFVREGVSASGSVASFGTKRLDVDPASVLSVAVQGTTGDDVFTINAPNAGAISFSGALGTGSDELAVRVRDTVAGYNVRNLKVDTSAVTGGEIISFIFDSTAANTVNPFDNDAVKLTSDSVISNSFTTIKVRTGSLDASLATIPAGIAFDVQSTVVLSYSQFIASNSFLSINDTGSLLINLTAAELTSLTSFLATAPASFTLIGMTVGLSVGGTIYQVEGGQISQLVINGGNISYVPVTNADANFAALQGAFAGIAGVSYPGIPGLQAEIDALQTQVATNGTDIAALAGRATTLETAVTLLNNTASVTGSVKEQVLTAKTAVEGLITALATRLDADIADLQADVASNTTDIAALTGRVTTLETAVTRLDGLATVPGSVKEQVLTAKTAVEGLITALATRLDADIADLQADVASNTTDIAALTGRVTTLETAVTRLDGLATVPGSVKEQVLTAKTAVEGLITALATRLDADIADLQADVASNTTDIAALTGRVTTLETAVTRLDGLATVPGSVKEQVLTAKTAVEGLITALATRLDADIADLQADVASNTTDIAALTGRVTTLETAVTRLDGLATVPGSVKEQVLTAKTAVEGLITALATRLDADIADLQADVASNTTDIAALTGRVTTLETAVTRLDGLATVPGSVKEQVLTAKTAVEGLITALATRLDADIADLQADVASNTTDIAALTGRVTTLETAVTRLDGLATVPGSVKEQVLTAKTAVEGLITALATRLDADIADLQADVASNTTDIAALTGRVTTLETAVTRLDGLATVPGSVKEQVLTAKTAVEGLITALATRLDADIADLQADVASNTTDIAALTGRVTTLETAVTRLDGLATVPGSVKEQVLTAKTAVEGLITALATRLDADIADLQADVASNTTDIAALTGRVTTLETAVTRLDGLATVPGSVKEQVLTAKTAVEGLITALATRLDADIADLQADVASNTTDIAALTGRVTTLETAVTRLDGLATVPGSVKEQVLTAKTAVEGLITALATRLDADIADLQADVASNTTDIAALTGRVTTLETAVTRLDGLATVPGSVKEQVLTAKTAVEGLITALATRLDADIADLQADVASNTTDIAALTGRVTTLETAVTRLDGLATVPGSVKEQVLTAKTAVEGLITALATRLDADIADLQADVASNTTDIAALTGRVTTLETAVTRLDGLATVPGSVKEQVLTAKTAVEGLITALATRLDADIADLQADVASNTTDIAALTGRVTTLETAVTRLDGLATVPGSVKEQVLTAKTALEGLITALATRLDADIADLQADVASNTTDIAALTGRVTTLETAVTRLDGLATVPGSVKEQVLTAKTAVEGLITALATRLDADIADLQADVASNTTDIAALTGRVTTLETAVTRLDGLATVPGSVKEQVLTAKTAVEGLITALATRLDADIADLQADVASNTTDIAALTGRVTTLETAVTRLDGLATVPGSVKEQVLTAKTAVEGLITALATRLDADIADLQADVASNTTDIAALTGRVTTLETAVTRLDGLATVPGSVKEQVLTAKTAVEGLITALATRLDADIADLQADVASNTTDIAALTGRVTTLETAVTRLDGLATVPGSVKEQVLTAKTAVEGLITALATRLDADIADLQADVASNTTDIAALTGRVTTLETAVTRLDGLATVPGSVKEQVLTAKTAVEGLITALATRLDADIADLQADVASNTTDIAALTGRVTTLETAVTRLDGLATVPGSVKEQVLTAKTAVEGLITALATRLDADLKAVSLTPTLSIVGTDLIDSVLETHEGDLVVRVSLPSVVATTDVVQLFLGGQPFGTPKTNTLDGTEVGNGYVDFTVTRADLGVDGLKALTAKIVSGAVTSNASPGLFFTLHPADINGPDAPVLDPVASNNLINKVEHDGTTWLTGTAEANARVTIRFLDENASSAVVSTRSVRADEFGNWSLPYSSVTLPADGTYTISVTATDAAGLTSAATTQTGVVIDSVVPTAPGINIVANDDIVDVLENVSGFTIAGTGENGATITLSLSSGRTLTAGNTTTVTGGVWSFAVASREAGTFFKNGDELITVTQTDAAGNISAETKRLIEVVNTLVAGGDLRALSVSDLSGLTRLDLNADAILPSSTAFLPLAIDARGYRLTAADTGVTLAAVTLANVGALTVNTGVTLAMTANQATSFNNAGGITLNGTGSVAVSASGNLMSQNLDKVSLTLTGATTLPDETAEQPDSINAQSHQITVAGPVSLVGVNLTNLGTITISTGATLTATAAQLTGQTVTGSGAVSVTSLQADTNLSNVNPAGGVTASVTANIDVTANVNLSNVDTYTVGGGFTLTANAAQVTGRVVEGLGAVSVKALEANTNLANVNPSGGVTAWVSTSIDITANNNLSNVDTYTVDGGFTLTANAAQVTGRTVDGLGAISVKALEANTNLANVNPDTGVTATVSSDINVTGNANLGNVDTYEVDSARTLTITAAQITGKDATGAGTVAVRELHATLNADLASIDTGGLTATAQLTNQTVNFTGNLGKAQVFILGTAGGALDIFNIDAANLGTATFTVTANAVLQGTAAKLTGKVATGAGTVAVTDLHATLGADLSGLDATTTTAAFNGNGTFIGTLDGAVVTVGDGFTMTAAASRVASETINKIATGKLAVTIGAGDATANVSSIAGNALDSVTVTDNVTFTGTLDDAVATTVDTGLTLTAAASVLTGKTVNGPGSVTVTALGATTDLSGVTVSGGVSIDLAATSLTMGAGKIGATGLTVISTGGAATLDLTGTGGDMDATALTAEAAVTLVVAAQQVGGKTLTTTGVTGANKFVIELETADNISAGALNVLVPARYDLSIADSASVSMSVAQHNGAGVITAGGPGETVVFVDSGSVTGNTSIETYVLADGNQTFTLGAAGQNVTTSGGTVTIDSNDFASLTGAIDGTAGTVTLQVTADSSVANATLTDVVIDLDSGVDLTLTYVQHALLGTGTNTNIVTLSGTVQDLTGNTSIESYVLASGTQTFTLGTAAQNVTTSGGTVTIDSNDFASLTGAIDGTAGTVTLQVTADSSVANATLTDVVIDLDSGVDLTLTYVQHALLGTGTNTNIVTLSGTVQDLTGNTSIESYVLASGTQTFTLGTAAQNVTTSGGTVTIDSNDFASLTGAIDGTAGTVTLQVTADSSVANATLTDVVIDLDSGVDLTLTYVQHALLGTGTNTNIVTLSGTVQDLTGNTSIESYVLASGTQTFTLGTAAQNVTTSGGTVTIDSNDFASLTGAIDGTAGTVTLQVTADSSVANATLTDVVIDLDSGVDLTLTYVQHALLGTGTDTNIVTLSGTVQNLTGNTSIESYVLASGTQTFTLGNAAQNVTTSGGTVTIDSNDFASLTGAIDGTAGTVTLLVTADSSVANATLTDVVIDLDSGVDLTLTYVQHALLGTGTNTNIVTLSGTAQNLTGNTSIESYVLASGTQTFTLGT